MVSPHLSDAVRKSPDFDDVLLAADRLVGVAHRTPVLTSHQLDQAFGCRLFFKAENFQRAGAFKFRGAFNAMSALSADQRVRGVVTYSSGNHAQAIALAGRILEAPRVVVMPSDAPSMKVAATRDYGAEVVFYDRYAQDREALGAAIADERGLALIPPYDHPDVIAGQGVATLELIEDVSDLDMILVPLGGGGLLAGAALSARARAPHCKLIGVEPEAGNDGERSFRAGRIIKIAPPRSIADGAIVTHLGAWNFPIIRELVDDVVTVSDDALVSAMKLFAERMKIIVEPTACLGLAAVIAGRASVSNRRVGILVSGGNVDLARFAELVS